MVRYLQKGEFLAIISIVRPTGTFEVLLKPCFGGCAFGKFSLWAKIWPKIFYQPDNRRKRFMVKACAVILAAGNGKRMKSEGSKVLCQVLGTPMIRWVYQNCMDADLASENICVVVGKSSQDVCGVLPTDTRTAVQEQRLGTGHAVLCAEEFLRQNAEKDVLILLGDAPFLFGEIIQKAYQAHKESNNAMTVVSAKVANPTGYGRILRGASGVRAIVEERDATCAERAITEINSGACWFKVEALLEALPLLTPQNAQGELYLTQVPAILIEKGLKVDAFNAEDAKVVLGANSRRELASLNQIAREMVFDKLYDAGVDIPVTDGVVISAQAEIGADTQILPGTIIKGHCVIGKGCVIGPGSVLEDAVIGDGCVIRNTYITRSVLEDDVQIGPFSQVRPDCRICRGVRIGDFVEVKNSVVGEDTHAAHLTYIGDTDCGKRVNFGCGVAIANYNGKKKFRTTIGDDCFIGCNTSLVSPVTIGDGAYTAAGSAVTVDVPADAVCIARSREVIKEGMALRYRKEKK